MPHHTPVLRSSAPSTLCPSGAHPPPCVPETAHPHLPEKTTPLPGSPGSAGALAPWDLTAAAWALLAPRWPAPARCGRPRSWPLRRLVQALFDGRRPGYAWRSLPRAYPPGQRASTTLRQGRRRGVGQCVHAARRRAVRLRAGRPAAPSAALRDSQRVKTPEEAGGLKGDEGGKQGKGRKRHGRGATLGRRLAVEGTPAHPAEQAGARRRRSGLKPLHPRLERLWAAGSSSGEPLATWGATAGAGRLASLTPTPHVQGVVVRPWGGMVERTWGGWGRQRRLRKDDARKGQTRERLLQLARMRLRLRRRARNSVGCSKHPLRRIKQANGTSLSGRTTLREG
jgi:putative transposase